MRAPTRARVGLKKERLGSCETPQPFYCSRKVFGGTLPLAVATVRVNLRHPEFLELGHQLQEA